MALTGSPRNWVEKSTSAAQIEDITCFLEKQGTFQFPRLPNGLFVAAAGSGADFEVSGYSNIWTRDNVHIAHAHLMIGEHEVAAQAVQSLMDFYRTQQRKLERIVAGEVDAANPMDRPHVRFNGHTLSELPEKWSHAQNDALGYLLWLYCLLVERGLLKPDEQVWEILALLVRYFSAIRYWEDEDSGHWEEIRKIAASSIGVALAGIRGYQRLLRTAHVPAGVKHPADSLLEDLIGQGDRAVRRLLPAECLQADPSKHRLHDAATLFLIYPCELLNPADPLAEQVISNVREHLLGEYGIRRYNGDSYWCNDYKQSLSAETRTADFSDDMSGRDSLLKPGFEAQWCIFDPILSVIFALRYRQTGSAADRDLQLLHLQRSLGQLTTADSRFGGFRCPESYYFEAGAWGPNDLTPLLWTQANLRLALHWWAATS